SASGPRPSRGFLQACAAARHHIRSAGRLHRRSGVERLREGKGRRCERGERPSNCLSAFRAEPQARLRSLMTEHINTAVNQEWPAMAQRRATLSALPTPLIEAMKTALGITPADEGQRAAQHEVIAALESALEARRQRIVISQ